ncbi:hypothetical protein PCK1_002686 [Pneumocystis canis]|nr:hypothetical protein PCK1_002686 [Pneumocystis canis]
MNDQIVENGEERGNLSSHKISMNVLNVTPINLSVFSASDIVSDDTSSITITPCADDIMTTSDESDASNGSDSEHICFSSYTPSFVELKPYKHQVGGHHTLFRFSEQAVCKPLVKRENEFYEAVEHLHRDLLTFMPRYMGVLNVTYKNDLHMVSLDKNAFQIHSTEDMGCKPSKAFITSLPKVSFEQNQHVLSATYPVSEHVEGKKGYPSRFPTWGTTTIHQNSREQILREMILSERSCSCRNRRKHRILRQRMQFQGQNNPCLQGKNQSNMSTVNTFYRASISPSLESNFQYPCISKRRYSSGSMCNNKESENFQNYTHVEHSLSVGLIQY